MPYRRSAKRGRRDYVRVTGEQFRDARVFAGLTREEAAQLLGVSLRTVGHWETGKARPAFAAFKLLRILRHGDMPDPAWSAYAIVRGRLVTPEGHAFEPWELSWLSLLVRRSHAFSDLLAQRDRKAVAVAGACSRVGASTPDAARPLASLGASMRRLAEQRPCEAGVAAALASRSGDSPRLIGESVKLNVQVTTSVGAWIGSGRPVSLCPSRAAGSRAGGAP